MAKYLAIKSVKADEKLARFLKTTKKELNTLFSFKAKDPLLFFVNQREDFDSIVGRKTENWLVGFARYNNIYIFDPQVYARESSHKKEEFWQTLKHEFSHVYYTQITKSEYPFWLNEGFACHISGKKVIGKASDKKILLNVFSYFDSKDCNIYLVGHFWVEFLIKKFGKKKLVELIKSINSRTNNHHFANSFYKIYGFKFDRNCFLKFF
jgi:hypothetical protein